MRALSGRVDEAAPALLGCRLRSDIEGATTEIVITEVEAYGGADDPASHASRGRTTRNRSMFERAGTLYVYRSYGVHWCLNVVTGPVGEGGAILVRGGEPTLGSDVMAERRGRADHLTDGPGKICQALAVTGEHDGLDLLGDGVVRLISGGHLPFDSTARVGISKAVERTWRFVART